jgi:hypothetical protein
MRPRFPDDNTAVPMTSIVVLWVGTALVIGLLWWATQ